MAGGAGEKNLEFTPTWAVAIVCTVIISLSYGVERFIHFTGKYFKRTNKKPLYESLLKLKEELMLMGFISLLLTVSQDRITKICLTQDIADSWLPCKLPSSDDVKREKTTSHWQRHLLAEAAGAVGKDYCGKKGKVPLLSVTALHHLHIFIFVLAMVHVVFCALTMMFGTLKMRQWKRWEEAIIKRDEATEADMIQHVISVKDHAFIRGRFLSIVTDSAILSWLFAFFKQFFASVTKADYTTLRLGFVMEHCRGNPKFKFHRYMMRVLEADFKKVVGISWYIWIIVFIFLSLNVQGWHAYFWIAFVPLVLLFALGTKLEHVITELGQEVSDRHVALVGNLVVKPSDNHFWFNKPRLVLVLIHIILFQNSFEMAFFIFISIQYSFDSCIMGEVRYTIPRLIIGIFVQVFCSYSTLPLYAIVTQMGSSFKKEIFDEHVQQGVVGWALKAKKGNKAMTKVAQGSSPSSPNVASAERVLKTERDTAASAMEEGKGGGEIELADKST